MDGPGEYYAQWNQSVKDKYHIFQLYVESKEQNKQNNKIETDS